MRVDSIEKKVDINVIMDVMNVMKNVRLTGMWMTALAAAVCGALTSCSGRSAAKTSESESGVVERLDSLFESRYAEGEEAPGGAVIIAEGDSVIYERYFGLADMETREPIDSNTRFCIASVSKQMTVVGLLQQGVDMQDAVSKWFDFKNPLWQNVTLQHLASHTSGVPDSRDRTDLEKCIYADDEWSASYFPTVTATKFAPGTAYDYLNPSFLLLAKVIERNSGMAFVDWQREHVFKPAGMDVTYYFNPKEHPEHTAHGYEPTPEGWKEFDYGEETFFATRPDGGVFSTARDMLRWEQALAHNTLLPPELLETAYRPVVEVSGSPWCDYQNRPNTYYALGWFVDRTPGEGEKVYHTGDNGGFQAYVAKYPATGLKIIVLENRHDKDRWEMAKTIDEIMGTGSRNGRR